MFKRLKKLYALSKKDPKALEVLENLTTEQMAIIPEEGDGKAVFFGGGTNEEYEQFKREEEGTDKWYKRLKNL